MSSLTLLNRSLRIAPLKYKLYLYLISGPAPMIKMCMCSLLLTFLCRYVLLFSLISCAGALKNLFASLKTPSALISIKSTIRNKFKDTGLWHSWPGHLPTGLSKTAAYLRYSRNHLRLLENVNKLSLHLSSSIQHSFSQRTKILLLLYTKLNRSVLRKNSRINKVLLVNISDVTVLF